MQGSVEKELPTLDGIGTGIMAYIHAHEPPTRERLEFVGVLIRLIVGGLKLTQKEKALYLEVYNRLIKKQIADIRESNL